MKLSGGKRKEKISSEIEEEEGNKTASFELNANMELEKDKDGYQDKVNSNSEKNLKPDTNMNLKTKS